MFFSSGVKLKVLPGAPGSEAHVPLATSPPSHVKAPRPSATTLAPPPSDADPRSETQWILLFLMGARLRASHENSQSRPNWWVASVQRDSRGSLSRTWGHRGEVETNGV